MNATATITEEEVQAVREAAAKHSEGLAKPQGKTRAEALRYNLYARRASYEESAKARDYAKDNFPKAAYYAVAFEADVAEAIKDLAACAWLWCLHDEARIEHDDDGEEVDKAAELHGEAFHSFTSHGSKVLAEANKRANWMESNWISEHDWWLGDVLFDQVRDAEEALKEAKDKCQALKLHEY